MLPILTDMRLPTLLLFTTVCLALAACSGQDESAPAEAIEKPDETIADTASIDAAGETPEQQRQRLRERMASHREESAETDTEPQRQHRQQLRERRDRLGQWWTDESLAAELELSEEQISAIESAAYQRREVLRDVRSELGQLRRQRSGESDAETAMDARQAARERIGQADRQWLDKLHEILTDDQLEALENHHPEALTRAQPGVAN